MNPSLSFDQAANFYDRTRPLFKASADAGIQALLESAGAEAHILEVGAGTGRISIPLLENGADLIGCDLSAKMLARQREKYPAARLAQTDAVYLPFPSHQFDAVVAVHVMHLIGPWREALREFKRVLKTNGVFLYVRTYEAADTSIRVQMRNHWRAWLQTQNVDTRHPGAQNGEEVKAELQSMGARMKEVEAVRFPHTYTLNTELNQYENRVFSDTWFVPESIHQASLTELRIWTAQEYGDLNQQHEETARFVIDIAAFDS